MNTFMLHQVHHILCHECQGSWTSVKYTQLLVKFVQLSNLPPDSTGTAIFGLNLFDIWNDCQRHNSLDT